MIKVVLPLVEDVISVDIKDTMRETVLDEEEDEVVVVIVMMIQVVRVIPIDIEDTEKEVIRIEEVKEDTVIVMIQVDQVIQEERIGDIEDIVVDIVRNQVIHPLIHLIVKVQVNHHQGKVNNIR